MGIPCALAERIGDPHAGIDGELGKGNPGLLVERMLLSTA